jgi:hypothetical protein
MSKWKMANNKDLFLGKAFKRQQDLLFLNEKN